MFLASCVIRTNTIWLQIARTDHFMQWFTSYLLTKHHKIHPLYFRKGRSVLSNISQSVSLWQSCFSSLGNINPKIYHPPRSSGNIVQRTMRACSIWHNAYLITVQHPADLSSQCLPVIEQNVWLPNEMVRKSHIVHTLIIRWIPLEVMIIPELWDTYRNIMYSYFTYMSTTYP